VQVSQRPPVTDKRPWTRLRHRYPQKAELLILLLQEPLNRFSAQVVQKALPSKEALADAIRRYVSDVTGVLIEWLKADSQHCDNEFVDAAREDLDDDLRSKRDGQLRRVERYDSAMVPQYRSAIASSITIAEKECRRILSVHRAMAELGKAPEKISEVNLGAENPDTLSGRKASKRGRKADPIIPKRREIVCKYAGNKSDLNKIEILLQIGQALDNGGVPLPIRRKSVGRPRRGTWSGTLKGDSALRNTILETLRKDITEGKKSRMNSFPNISPKPTNT
jgi:hypothetical protein